MANIVCPTARPQMATVVAGVFGPVTTEAAAEVVRERVDAAPDDRIARQIERRRPEAASAPLATADVVVAGGFGVGSKERWALVEELAARSTARWALPGRRLTKAGRARPDDRRQRRVRLADAVPRRRHLRHDAPRRRHPRREDHRRDQQQPTGADLRDGRLRHRRRPRRGAAGADPSPADRRGPRAADRGTRRHQDARGVQGGAQAAAPEPVQTRAAGGRPGGRPGHAQDGRRPLADLRGRARPALPGTDDDHVAPDGPTRLALPVGHPVGGRHDRQQPDEAPDVPDDGHLHRRALRGLGGAERHVVHDVRRGHGARHRLSRAPEGVAGLGPGAGHHARRRAHRSQGQSAPGPPPSRPTRTCTSASSSDGPTGSSCAGRR